MGCTAICKRPFIVRETPAPMLRRNPEVNKGARHLWATMWSMRDVRTGELRHKDHWYRGEEIDYRAEICKRSRKDLMKELLAAGLVFWKRDRVVRVIKDRLTGHRRLRSVLGPTKYFVFASPHKHSASSTVQSLHGARNAPTNLSEIHQSGGGVAKGVAVSGLGSKSEDCNIKDHHQAQTKTDDDPTNVFLPDEKPNRFALLQDRARDILVEQGEDRETVELAIQWLDERAASLGKTPASAQYYVACFESLKANPEEWEMVSAHVNRRRARREKYMPGFTGKLTPEQEEERHVFLARYAGGDAEGQKKGTRR